MVWTPSAPELPRSFGAAPVPDVEGLRRAALQASWRRDRRVAQRRMAMRWAVWYALRGLPLLAVAAAAWLWVSNQTVVPGSPVLLATPPKPATAHPPQGEPVLQLRLESPLQSAPPASGAPSASVPIAGKSASATESPSPQLKPDNWLHSKEP